MKKYVYLYELDSVRKTDEEIIKGQKVLYDEIAVNGNCVVLTFNQLVDSRGFFSLLKDEKYYKNLIEMFERGMIRISQFSDIRTVSQYLLSTIDDDKEFIYSALPIKSTQKRLLAMMKRSLIYSDLSEVYRFAHTAGEDELTDLFIEVNGYETSPTELSVEEMRHILENLYALLGTVLRLSSLNSIYFQPRKRAEYSHLRLNDILKIAIETDRTEDLLWQNACAIIRGLKQYKDNNLERSAYINELISLSESQELTGYERQAYQYAEAIIDLAYNYACEISICDTSKHYDITELTDNNSDRAGFYMDFANRLALDWENGREADERYLQKETNEFNYFTQLKKIPDFSRAVRLAEYAGEKQEDTSEPENVPRYEYRIGKDQKKRKQRVCFVVAIRILMLLSCIGMAWLVDVVLSTAQDLIPYHIIIVVLVFLFVSELVTKFLKWVDPIFMPMGEVLDSFVTMIVDAFKTIFTQSGTYVNTDGTENVSSEKRSTKAPIEIINSKDVKKYIKRRNEKNGFFREEDFSDSDIYPIADTNNIVVQKDLQRLEELYKYNFGIAYDSKYYDMVVDPVEGGKDGYFPYARVFAANNLDGVAAVVVHNGNFVLIEQFRHSIRRSQYCFPRGFLETGETPEEGMARELKEELKAKVIGSLKPLGTIIADSGMAKINTHIFVAEVSSYEAGTNNEGILGSVEVPIDKLDAWIIDNKVDDSFTLSAYALYKIRKYLN